MVGKSLGIIVPKATRFLLALDAVTAPLWEHFRRQSAYVLEFYVRRAQILDKLDRDEEATELLSYAAAATHECNRSKYLKLAGFRFPFHELTIHNPMNVRFTHEVVDLTWNTVLPKDKWDFCSVKDSHNVSRFYPGGTNT